MIDFKKVKLVIWDLDDTFWTGTLSEEVVSPITRNCQLVQKLTERGIINTICSKNDYAPVVEELKKMGLLEYFVFISVDWSPKGPRISHLIKEMGLRPSNCLFLDDNIVNLNEAKFYSSDLMVGEPSAIEEMSLFVDDLPISDPQLNRLQQYKVLEQKQQAKALANDNLSFLYASNTRVEIKYDCMNALDRIYELIHRTNQLNFTKNRCTKDELISIIDDDSVECGYVTACDNFGDYGIVGFYAKDNNRLVHFLFSCRTIGQGVEQWVYSTIGCPELEIVGEVVNVVEMVEAPAWINQDGSCANHQFPKIDNTGKIIFKGPCDLDILTSFLKTSNLITEFTYISSDRHNSIEHHNHSINYLSLPFLDKKTQQSLVDECIFNDSGIFTTSIYDKDVSLIVLSTLPEPNLGIYRRKADGIRIAFGEWTYDLTDRSNWEYYKSESPYLNTYTDEFLFDFASKYEFEGRQSVETYIQSIEKLLTFISPDAKLCLILGVEIPYKNNEKQSYHLREEYHKELNERLRMLANSNNRVYLLDFGKYVSSQSDFLDNINHFQRNVYYLASKDLNNIIEEVCGYRIKESSVVTKTLVKFAGFIRKFLNPQTAVYRFLRKSYRKLRGL